MESLRFDGFVFTSQTTIGQLRSAEARIVELQSAAERDAEAHEQYTAAAEAKHTELRVRA